MKARPKHLFVAYDGDLHDTRAPNWAKTPLREGFARAYRDIETTAQLRSTLRHGQYAWPGGYALYFITSDGATLSFDAVRKNLRSVLDSVANRIGDGWRVVACDSLANYDSEEPLFCDASGVDITTL